MQNIEMFLNLSGNATGGKHGSRAGHAIALFGDFYRQRVDLAGWNRTSHETRWISIPGVGASHPCKYIYIYIYIYMYNRYIYIYILYLYYIISYHIILYYIMLNCIILYYIKLYYIILYYIILYIIDIYIYIIYICIYIYIYYVYIMYILVNCDEFGINMNQHVINPTYQYINQISQYIHPFGGRPLGAPRSLQCLAHASPKWRISRGKEKPWKPLK